MRGYGQCPRCGMWAVEHLRTHSHCWECSYSPQAEIKSRVMKQTEENYLNDIGYRDKDIVDADAFDDDHDEDEEMLDDLCQRENAK